MKKSIDRLYHPYWDWEETKTNMWGKVKDRKDHLKKAIEFTGNHELYGSWMIRVVIAWKYSCEHNLSNTSSNRQAWIGHAACAMAFNCPEDIVRCAWGYLSDEQQSKANAQADKAIAHWEENYRRKLCQS